MASSVPIHYLNRRWFTSSIGPHSIKSFQCIHSRKCYRIIVFRRWNALMKSSINTAWGIGRRNSSVESHFDEMFWKIATIILSSSAYIISTRPHLVMLTAVLMPFRLTEIRQSATIYIRGCEHQTYVTAQVWRHPFSGLVATIHSTHVAVPYTVTWHSLYTVINSKISNICIHFH